MSSYKKTIVLGLDYSEFSGGMQECNTQMKNLDAEFAFMQSRMEEGSNASDKLSARQEYLTQKIHIQTQKVEEAKKKYNALMDAHADTSKINKADQALLKERTTLENMKNELRDVQYEQSNFKESATALVSTITVLATGFYNCAKNAADYADQVTAAAEKISVSTETVQGWMYASEMVDVSTDRMIDSIKEMENNMQSANQGTGDAAAAFQILGVKITDAAGNMRNAEDVFYDTIDALGQVKNATEQDQLAMNIFGEEASELTGIIEIGSKGLVAYRNEAKELGRVMSQDDLEAAKQFDDVMEKLRLAFESLQNSLGLTVIPVLTGFIEAIASIPTPVLAIIATIISTVTILVTLVNTINSVMQAGEGISKIFKVVNGTFDSTYAKIILAVLAFTALATIIAVIIGKSGELNRTINNVGNMANTYTNTKSKPGYNANGTQNWGGGLTWVGENGPELAELPPGTRIYNNKESNNIAGNKTYNIHMNCDMSKIKSVSDMIDVIEGIEMSAQCGGVS